MCARRLVNTDQEKNRTFLDKLARLVLDLFLMMLFRHFRWTVPDKNVLTDFILKIKCDLKKCANSFVRRFNKKMTVQETMIASSAASASAKSA